MLTAEAHVRTERASRYLVQLCEHLNQIGHRHDRDLPHAHNGAAPAVQGVEWTDQQGVVTVGRGRCTLNATPQTLTLRIEAADSDTLQQIMDMLTKRLEMIGRRDQLTVTW